MTGKYILDGHTPVPEPDLMKWAAWFEHGQHRVVKQDVTLNDVKVSTVFLGVDHSFGEGPPIPILFETMIFGGPLDGAQERCSTWDEAEAQHELMLMKAMLAQTGDTYE